LRIPLACRDTHHNLVLVSNRLRQPTHFLQEREIGRNVG
jgi:hypothetical protein